MSENTIKALILDFDGTLGDTEPVITSTMLQTLSETGLPLPTREECRAVIGLPLRESFMQLMPMSNEQGTMCETTYRRLFMQNADNFRIKAFPNVVETLNELHRRGIILTVASSRNRESLDILLRETGILDIVSLIVAGDEVVHAKPNPEPVQTILNSLGLPSHEAMVVGDAVYDIEMGRRAGTHTCAVSYGNGTQESLRKSGAEHIISDFAQLAELV